MSSQKDEKKNEKKYKVKRYDFRSDTLNITPGYRVISQHFWPVYEHPTKPEEDWVYDFDSSRGRILYETPTKTDTVYYNTPDKFISHDTGYMPVGTTKNQEESKKWWYKWLEWANPVNKGAQKIKQNELEKHQQGGIMNQQQGIEQQVVQLVQAAAAGDQKATQQIEQIMKAAQQGNQDAIQIAQVIQKVIQGLKAKQGIRARLGAKLDYINKLKGNCPDGSEPYYFKEGGSMKKGCKPCMQKAQSGAKTKKVNEVQKFKSRNVKVSEFKGKANEADTVHVNKNIYSLTNSDGSRVDKRFPAYSTEQYKKDAKTKDGKNRRFKQDLVSSEKCGGKAKKNK